MIKRLIKDLTYNKISLKEGLNRAKIIAFEIKNDEFKNWLNSELNGYKLKDLPEYRKISCEVVADIQNPFHGKRTIPYDLSAWDKELQGMIYKFNVLQSIPTIETNLKNVEPTANSYLYEYMPIGLVQQFKEMTTDGEDIVSIRRKFQAGQVFNILEITKQKLVDTLLELNEKFPDLEDDYEDNPQNSEIAKTIINNNILGDTSNSNISFGDNVKQIFHNKRDQKIQAFLNLLQELNIDNEEVKKAERIIDENKDSPSLGKKLLNWTGNIASKSIEKGIELKIPMIIDKIQDLL
ncbi:hypothetical protein [Christiangramia flava]|uniref:Uncharacterized protein n=2 Tax=Christiangramia TaxID=292691 RepID=A0A1L7I7H7_9FLAO|nr:hypothetical protein [Christiangramia flava]APU69561.1 hypothetical protein GRFL_2837 [Christiangramia flava JLT2011]OSS37462.1 hypothetical protein C723_3625 [Christiangramia flava JLT2011]